MACSLVALVGIATAYAGPYIGQPLYCGGVYDLQADPWIAMPIGGGGWECGDLVYLRFADGSTLMARAMDAGPLSLYNVEGQPIIADIPAHLAPFALSGPIELYNFGEAARRCQVVR
jgi:hypothetical protein